MSERGNRSFASSSVPVTFLSVMALLVLVLGWLGWLLLNQDRLLEDQRTRERVDAAVAELEDALAAGIAAERSRLDEIAEAISSGQGTDVPQILDTLRGPLTLIHFSVDRTTAMPEHGLRYLPVTRKPEALPPQFARADRLEFQQQDYPAAMRLLTPMVGSSDRHVQASALMRLGRISRRDGRIDDALTYYETLVGFTGQTIATAPADWLGRYARCTIFEVENRLAELAAETSRLAAVLTAGGRHASATTYRFYVAAATRWAGLAGRPDLAAGLAQPHALSDMAVEFLDMWNDRGQGLSPSSGIRIAGSGHGYVLGIWSAFDADLLAGMLRIDDLHAASLAAVTNRLEGEGIGWRVSDAAGKVLLSGLDGGGTPTIRSLALGGTMFTVAAFATPSLVPDPGDINRRQLLLTGLLLILTMILASTYVISRSLRREAEISRLQSDFVAAVSHEFRTPLTSIRQLTELLASGRVESQDKAAAYYRVLDKESTRLQRLVEGLLDFGRMEAGAHPYHPELLDCAKLLNDIVGAFREENDLTAEGLSLDIEGTPYVRMDKESFTRAIWNLLDNAVKYSAGTVAIEVKALLKNGKVRISIADHGVGFPAEEQSRIFSKFVRGSAAALTNAKGTGLGLAMVQRIIEDQGGAISARSSQGEGSVFTITLESTKPQ